MASKAAKAVSRAAAVALLAGLALDSGRTSAQFANSIGGDAYGALVQTPTASLARSPLATLDPATGFADAAAASVSALGVLSAESLSSIVSGVVGENAASAQSSSTLQNVNILNGLITAKAVRSLASSASTGTSAVSNTAGSGFVALVINGLALADGAPAPNTRIALPGVGTAILNEQVGRGDGRTASGISVNMIHVLLQDLLTGATTGEIVAGAARSDVTFVR